MFQLTASHVSVNNIIAALDDSDITISGSEDESDSYETVEHDNERKSESSLSESSDEDVPLKMPQTNTSIKGNNKGQTKTIGAKDCLMLEIPCGVVSLILVMSGIHRLNS